MIMLLTNGSDIDVDFVWGAPLHCAIRRGSVGYGRGSVTK